MTTPTREQVAHEAWLEWQPEAIVDLKTAFYAGFNIARAELEASIAEQATEISKLIAAVADHVTVRAEQHQAITELQRRLGNALGLLDAETQFEAKLNLRNIKATIAEQAVEIERLQSGIVCGDCDGSGWLENRVEGRYPCTCLTEAEPYQLLEQQLTAEQSKVKVLTDALEGIKSELQQGLNCSLLNVRCIVAAALAAVKEGK